VIPPSLASLVIVAHVVGTIGEFLDTTKDPDLGTLELERMQCDNVAPADSLAVQRPRSRGMSTEVDCTVRSCGKEMTLETSHYGGRINVNFL